MLRDPANGISTRLLVGWYPSIFGTRDKNCAALAALMIVVMHRHWRRGVRRNPPAGGLGIDVRLRRGVEEQAAGILD